MQSIAPGEPFDVYDFACDGYLTAADLPEKFKGKKLTSRVTSCIAT